MLAWPQRPTIYEINTWVWLYELSRREGRAIYLGNVPAQDWDTLGSLGIDALWLMGVWERSPVSTWIAKQNEDLLTEFRRVLPDFTLEDIVGSPYCVRRYVVDEHLGGPAGLAAARKMLADRGMRLILDFVPNHVAPDHPWVTEHPDYFIQGSADDLTQNPGEFFEAEGVVIAHGRDPYFPSWQDVVQLNAFNAGLRKAAIETVTSIAGQCDGIRCDMAMLLMNPIFERTWGRRAGAKPEEDYWPEVIQAARQHNPHVLFMAEAYWDLEWELQQQGFDYCYDKRLYDRLEHDQAEQVRQHLRADLPYQEKLVRFIENHDELRAAATFPISNHRAAAVTIATLPGARLFHDGQFEGRQVKLPVFLRRRPAELPVPALQAFYRRLLTVINRTAFREGEWRLCESSGWPDNVTFANLVTWCFRKGVDRYLIVVNLSDSRSQGQVRLPWDDLSGRSWRLTEALTGQVYEQDGNQLCDSGLYVDLESWGFHVLKF